jgi:Bacterial regulatory proteins, tetR family
LLTIFILLCIHFRNDCQQQLEAGIAESIVQPWSFTCQMRQIAQRSDIQDLILDGVDVLLSRYGYRKMTMDHLARQVGIGKGTIYLHFPSKEEVTLSHINRIVETNFQMQ